MKLSDNHIIELNKLILDGLVRKVKHPYCEMYIYKYTNEATHLKPDEWSHLLKECRGLILDIDYNIIAKSFKKFFNLEEHSDIDINTFNIRDYEIIEKLDGSLIIVFWNNQLLKWDTATMGSFTSEQAEQAFSLLFERNLFRFLDMDYTYLFELISPENKIVVNYDETKLKYLSSFSNISCIESNKFNYGYIFETPKTYDFKNISDILNYLKNIKNFEGFVLKHKITNERYKIKSPEYLRLHLLRNYMTPKNIFELYIKKVSLNEIKTYDFPDLYELCVVYYKQIKDLYISIRKEIFEIYNDIIKNKLIMPACIVDDKRSRKAFFADIIQNTVEQKDYHSILYKIFDMKEIDMKMRIFEINELILNKLVKNRFLCK